MDPRLVTPMLFAALLAFGIYRRVRRNIGRQALSPGRLGARIAIFAAVGAMILLVCLRDPNLFGAMAAGLAGGLLLAWFGLRHTQFEVTPQGRFYTPHTYIGVFVSALFLGRILFRYIAVCSTAQAMPQAVGNPFAAYQRSPLTLGIFGVLVGYYVAYYAGVLIRSRALAAAAGSPDRS